MNPKLKKMWPIAAASLVCFTSLAQAANGSTQQPESRMQSSSMRNQGAPRNDVINPAARPTVKDGVDLFVSGDFLWWNASQDDLQFTATVNEGFNACCNGLDEQNVFLRSKKGVVQEPDFDWCPGFRIGLGYNMAHDGWDVFFQWTRLYADNKVKKCAFPCDALFSSTAVPPSPPAVAAGFDACCITCNKCQCDPCCCNGSFRQNGTTNGNSSFNNNFCCNTKNPCNNCPQCCPSMDCDCCCEPCCPCCDVCFDCCCPTSLIPTLCPYSTPDNYMTTTVAVEKWRLRFNMLDGEIGREFYVSKQLTLRPFFGVRGLWVSQKYNVDYEAPVNYMDPAFFDIGDVSVGQFDGCQICCTQFDHCFDGVGPRFGFDTDWMLGGGFSFYADAAISLIWGKYEIEVDSNICLKGNLNLLNRGTDEFEESEVCDCARYCLSDSFHSGKAMTDIGLGLKWAGTFASDRVGLMIKIGYDNHLLINHNQLIQFVDQTNPPALAPLVAANNGAVPSPAGSWNRQLQLDSRRTGDLVLHGLVVSAQLDF